MKFKTGILFLCSLLILNGCTTQPSAPSVQANEKIELKEETGIATFTNTVPIVIHREKPYGKQCGTMQKNDVQPYTYVYEDENYKHIAWKENGELCFCIVSSYSEGNETQWATLQNQIGVYYKDLKTNETYIYNNEVMYPCSIIKMCVMTTIYHEADQGKVNLEECLPYLEAMMIDSDNTSYNELLAILGDGNGIQGLECVNEYMKKLGLKNTELHHGLTPGNGYFTDGGDNTSTPEDIGILLEKIYRNQAATKKSCLAMISLMKRCADNQGIALGLDENCELAHKSGWADAMYLDGGIVYAKNHPYILVLFTNEIPDKNAFFETISACFYKFTIE